MKCPSCGCENEEDAEFCKECGRRFRGFFEALDDKINIASLFTGLIVSVLVLILSSLFLLAAGITVTEFTWIPLVILIFIIVGFAGGLVAGLGRSDTMDGFINGLFLGLSILIILGFLFGLALLSLTLLVNAIKTTGGLSAATEAGNPEFPGLIVNGIIFVLGTLSSGAVGGSLGSCIKRLL
ncbi:conserved hypothetical protein [Methanothermobacter sp. MT-2]|nr:conserved hypothetical protein [Methanothermobacter sp. MT-2]HHW04866.1 hypothetical protein [Methanothermobacter sp.]